MSIKLKIEGDVIEVDRKFAQVSTLIKTNFEMDENGVF